MYIILFSLKKEGYPAICDNMDGPEEIMLSKISQIQKEKNCMISLICGIKKGKYTESESRIVVNRSREVGEMRKGSKGTSAVI